MGAALKNQILQVAHKLILNGAVPSRLGVAELVAAVPCAEKEFARAFPSFSAFQRELCALLFSDSREAVIQATSGMQSGLEQVKTAFLAYLDYNFENPALQELAHHIQLDPAGWELLQRMEVGVALVVQADLEAMGATLRTARAQLLTSLAVAVVRAEYRQRRMLPEMREALLDYCRLSGRPPAA